MVTFKQLEQQVKKGSRLKLRAMAWILKPRNIAWLTHETFFALMGNFMGYQTVKCKNLLNASMHLQCRKIVRYISGHKCLLCPGMMVKGCQFNESKSPASNHCTHARKSTNNLTRPEVLLFL